VRLTELGQGDPFAYGLEALYRILLSDGDLDHTLRRVAELAMEALPMCDIADITLVKEDSPNDTLNTANSRVASAVTDLFCTTGDRSTDANKLFDFDSAATIHLATGIVASCLSCTVANVLLVLRARAFSETSAWASSQRKSSCRERGSTDHRPHGYQRPSSTN